MNIMQPSELTQDNYNNILTLKININIILLFI